MTTSAGGSIPLDFVIKEIRFLLTFVWTQIDCLDTPTLQGAELKCRTIRSVPGNGIGPSCGKFKMDTLALGGPPMTVADLLKATERVAEYLEMLLADIRKEYGTAKG